MAASPLGAARRAPPTLVARRRGMAARTSVRAGSGCAGASCGASASSSCFRPGARSPARVPHRHHHEPVRRPSIGGALRLPGAPRPGRRGRRPSARAARHAAPVGDLIEAAGRVEAGEIGTQVEVRGPSEVRSLARAFNAMSSTARGDRCVASTPPCRRQPRAAHAADRHAGHARRDPRRRLPSRRGAPGTGPRGDAGARKA